MKKIAIVFFLLTAGIITAQDKGFIEGLVVDRELNYEPLAFAHVSLKELKENTTSNIDGAYAFEVVSGIYTLVVNFPGYEKIEIPEVVVKSGEITSIKEISLGTLQIGSFTEASESKDKK